MNVIRENHTNDARNRINSVYINETLHLEQIISDLRAMGYVAFHHNPQITGELEELDELRKHLFPFFQHIVWIEVDPLTQYAVVNNMGKATMLKLIGRRMNHLRDLRANTARTGQPIHELDRETERLEQLVRLLRYTRFA